MTSLASDSIVASSIGAGGIHLHTEELPWLKSVAVGFVLPFGSASESKANNGAAHFIEHLLFKGTKKRTARQIVLAVERYGGSMNAATEKELTSYYCRIDAKHLPVALEVLGDLCFNAAFKPSLVERERTVVVEEIEGNQDDPPYFLFEQFLMMMWGDSKLGRPITGTPATVRAMPRDTLYKLYREYYRPDDMVLAVAGGVSHDQVAKTWEDVAKRLGVKGKGRAKKLQIPRIVPRVQPSVLVYQRVVEQASVVMGFPGIHIGAPDRHTMACMDGVLAGGMGGRLFQSLRERQGLVYDVGTMHLGYRATGLYVIEASSNPERLYKVVRAILKECRRLREQPVPRAELKRVQDFLAGSYALSLESSSSRMFRLALSHLYLGHFETPEEVLNGIREVTPDMIHEFSQRLFDPAGLGMGVVVPESWPGADRCKDELTAMAAELG